MFMHSASAVNLIDSVSVLHDVVVTRDAPYCVSQTWTNELTGEVLHEDTALYDAEPLLLTDRVMRILYSGRVEGRLQIFVRRRDVSLAAQINKMLL